jgi:hypothetical protein
MLIARLEALYRHAKGSTMLARKRNWPRLSGRDTMLSPVARKANRVATATPAIDQETRLTRSPQKRQPHVITMKKQETTRCANGVEPQTWARGSTSILYIIPYAFIATG